MHPVGADNSVIAADLGVLYRYVAVRLGIWLREDLAFRHCWYPCHIDSPAWRCCILGWLGLLVRSCAARILDCVADLRSHLRPGGGDGWLAGCRSRSSTW
jgi:hypothetical protein